MDKEKLKRIGKALLYPHMAMMIVLVVVSAVTVPLAMVYLGTESVISVITYVISAYTLTVWCFRIPEVITLFKRVKAENKYVRKWLSDERLRLNVSLNASFVLNVIYAIFQLGLGIFHSSFWFYSMACYYFSLALMRLYLVKYTGKKREKNMVTELYKYRLCGWVFLVMNLAITLMVFFMVYFGRTFVHHEITTIALAAYTFTSFTKAIITSVKYRRYDSPVYSAAKNIGIAAACVSMLTLESTMLTTFGGADDPMMRKILLSTSGGAISSFIIAMAIYMIYTSTSKIRKIKENAENAE